MKKGKELEKNNGGGGWEETETETKRQNNSDIYRRAVLHPWLHSTTRAFYSSMSIFKLKG